MLFLQKHVTIPFLDRRQRMTIAMCRSGTMFLEIERGRNKPREQRVCRQCDYGEVEDVVNAYVVSAIMVKWRMWYTCSDAKNMNKYDMTCIITIITV